MGRWVGICLAAGLVSGCSTSTPAGPDGAELAALIARSGRAAPALRAVRCDFIEEEGSEWRCRYQERASDGRWVPLETYVARDGGGWVLIDEAGNPDAAR